MKMEAKPIKRVVLMTAWLISFFTVLFAQDSGTRGNSGADEQFSMPRGSIPQELLRPRRDEAPRYPIDTVIGSLGQGEASAEAFSFAGRVASALTGGIMNDRNLSTMNTVRLEGYMSALGEINPRSFRLGGGRVEADGTFSFMVRFMGREQSITGELFVRYEVQEEAAAQEDAPAAVDAEESASGAEGAAEEIAKTIPRAQNKSGVWVFDELILEEARSRQSENEDVKHRFDLPPYERLF
jgi:hypothetical protein